MRISDWSSDVCSSDLEVPGDAVFAEDLVDAAIFTDALQKAALRDRKLLCHGRACWLLLTNNTLQFVSRRVQRFFRSRACRRSSDHSGERKRAALGKRVTDSVDLGSRRSINKKNN